MEKQDPNNVNYVDIWKLLVKCFRDKGAFFQSDKMLIDQTQTWKNRTKTMLNTLMVRSCWQNDSKVTFLICEP